MNYDQAPPSVLYKYVGSAQHHLDILATQRIRFTQPDDLNDPFDCVPGVLPPVDVAKFVDATIARNQSVIIQSGYPSSAISSARAALIQEYIHKPDALLARCSQIVRRNLNVMGVLSLAEQNDSLPMWAHYAANHSGFVIGFRLNGSPFAKRPNDHLGEGELKPVIYQPSRLMVPCDPLVFPPELLYVKTSNWSYESEWRIVRQLSSCDHALADSTGIVRFHLWNIEPNLFDSVYLGMNADPNLESEVKRLTSAGTHLQHVSVFRARLDAGGTRLVFDPA